MGLMKLAAVLVLLSLQLVAQVRPAIIDADRTRWFQDAKFGVFVHWGPYSVLGRHEWAREFYQIPQAEYDKYARAFNPTLFKADDWVNLAANAGARYMVITSKHHDGFSIYRSQISDYDMQITPYAGDPLKDLARAAQAKGMKLGYYHSIMDWHHPDYIPKRAWEKPNQPKGGNIDAFIPYLKEQIRELLTQYGPVAVMWFDGEWEHSLEEMHSDEIYDFIRGLSPNTLINDRLYKRQPGNKADFGTPEQFVPATGMRDPSGKPVLWESCVTINTSSWGYNQYETDFKTSRDLIRMLVEVVSKGGNLLLNVGPKPDGRIQDEFVTRLNAMGDWMRVNGDSIYGTTASPFARLPFFGRATVKGDKLYLHVFEWPASGHLRVPGLKNSILSAKLLASPLSQVDSQREGDDVVLKLPAGAPDPAASVIELQLDGAPNVLPYRIGAGAGGVYELSAASSEIETEFEQRAKKENMLGHVFVTKWTRGKDVPYWVVNAKPGRYQVAVTYGASRASEGTPFTVSAGESKVSGNVAATGNDLVFRTVSVGAITLAGGEQTIRIRADVKEGASAMNLERITLTPADEEKGKRK